MKGSGRRGHLHMRMFMKGQARIGTIACTAQAPGGFSIHFSNHNVICPDRCSSEAKVAIKLLLSRTGAA
eukprot:782673-Pelagomonas_calceolata.AAC.1